MASTLATLSRTENGFRGTLSTLTIKAPIAVLENRTKKDGSDEPDFRVIATRNGFEVGAAWTRTSKTSGKEYISVSLTAPEFGKIFANIAQAPGGKEDEYVMIWNPGEN